MEYFRDSVLHTEHFSNGCNKKRECTENILGIFIKTSNFWEHFSKVCKSTQKYSKNILGIFINILITFVKYS